MSEKTNRIIMVLMDDVKSLPLDQTMKSYVKTHTYLSRSDKLFNERLLYAMPDTPLIDLRGNTGWSNKPWYCKYIGSNSRLFVPPDDTDIEDEESNADADCDEVDDCTINDVPKSKSIEEMTKTEIP